MSILQRLFGAAIDRKVQERVQELLPAAVAEKLQAASFSARPEDAGWRKLTGAADRSLDSLTQDRMIEIAFWLWENNPLANWIIEIIVSFVVEGLTYEATNEDVKAVLDDFWDDPCNAMDLYLEKHCRELHIFGELLFPAFVAVQTGKLRLGIIDPAQIGTIETDPENIKMIVGVILKAETGKPARRLKVIVPRGGEEILSPAAQEMRRSYTDGECFIFGINTLSNSPRGRSELLPIADWLDAYEQFLFDYADKWPLLNSFVWDLLVTGGDKPALDEQLKAFTKKSGSVYAHNEKVTLNAVTPDLKSVDVKEGARLFRNHILGAKGIPEHWFGGGGDVNRATAAEMDAPTLKMLARKQTYFKFMLERIFDEVIGRALDARYLRVPEDEAYAYTINMPELASRDISKFSTAIQQLTTSLVGAETQGWIDRDNASKIFAFCLQMIGYELDLDAIQEKLKTQEETKGYDDYRNTPPPTTQRPAGAQGIASPDGDQNAE